MEVNTCCIGCGQARGPKPKRSLCVKCYKQTDEFKALHKEYNKKYQALYPERVRQSKADWKKRNPEKVREQENANYNPVKARQAYLKRKPVLNEQRLMREYGITSEWVELQMASQGSACYICKMQLVKSYIDHCHTTQKVRKILCNKCNVGLHYIENIEFLANALAYIKEHNEE